MASADPAPLGQAEVRLSEVVAAISLAADLGLGQPMEHVLRSCVIAVDLAGRLGASREDVEATYWVTLLVTAGCTGVSHELAEQFGDDIALRSGIHDIGPSDLDQLRYFLARAGQGRSVLVRTKVRATLLATRLRPLEESLAAHCAVSGQLSDRVGLGEDVTRALGQTFARWDGKGIPRGVGGEDISLPMRICQLAEAVEVRHRAAGLPGTLALARDFAGTWLDPRLARTWQEVGGDVLDQLSEGSSWHEVVGAEPTRRGPLSPAELDSALEVVADFADLKSPWFAGHSRGVADLAAAAARLAGRPEPEVTNLRRAALLHELGRNGVPNTVWDKAGRLSQEESERMRLHAYLTDRVVRRAGALAPLAPVASATQEREDGSGYPRGLTGAAIPPLGRLLAAADVYHALQEARPHRGAVEPDVAAATLRRMATAGRLHGPSVDAVLAAGGHRMPRRPSAPAGLTPREVEVLAQVARGATLREVGSRLGISPKTAGNHVERIYTKIAVSSRAEAAMYAMRHGLIGPVPGPGDGRFAG